MFDLHDKAAIVTGSAKGLGKEFAERLLAKGCKVCLSDVDEKTGEAALEDLATRFGKEKVLFVKCDVTKETDWHLLWTEAETKFGYISVLVNNAGVNFDPGWRKGLDIMLYGFTTGFLLALSKMARTKGGSGGRIINTASIAGLTNFPFELERCMGYTMAKWGVIGLTRNFAAANPSPEKVEGIKCMSICPWYTKTDLVGQTMIEKVDKSPIRSLKITEVGLAFDKLLDRDVNGTCLMVLPDAPLMDVPNMGSYILMALIILGKVLRRLNLHIEFITFPRLLLLFALLFLAFAALLWQLWTCIVF